MTEFTHQTVLVTGANRGVGLGLAREAKSRGMTVLGTARNTKSAAELREIADEVFTLDTSEGASIELLAKSIGDRPLHLLINNAAVFPQRDLDALDHFDVAEFDAGMRVNVTGPLRTTQVLLPNLRAGAKASGGATVCNVTSVLGSLERVSEKVTKRWYGYCASKAALTMATVVMRRDLEDEGIECIAVHPGWVQTDMGGAEADLTPQESARGILDTLANPPKDRGDHALAWDGSVLPF